MGRTRKEVNGGGTWNAEEDRAPDVETRRCRSRAEQRRGKSCRLRWLNYLRLNIKRGRISDREEDLILRLHCLLGNRWSFIAGRPPGSTDNEIKNYRNTHLSRKVKQTEKVSQSQVSCQDSREDDRTGKSVRPDEAESGSFGHEAQVDGVDDEGPLNLEWMSRFTEMDENWFNFALPA